MRPPPNREPEIRSRNPRRPVLRRQTMLVLWGAAACVVTLLLSDAANCQRLRAESESSATGIVRDLSPGKMTIVDADGKAINLRIQNKGESSITLAERAIRFPAKIKVSGTLSSDLIEPGMVARVTVETNRRGKTQGAVKSVEILAAGKHTLSHKFSKVPDGKEFSECRFTGRVLEKKRDRLKLAIPDSDLIRKQMVTIQLADNCQLLVSDNDLDRVISGDTVTHSTVVEMSTGELAVREIEIELTAPRERMTRSFHDQLAQKFSLLSDEPAAAREVRSGNFVLYTDISDRSAQILLAKLETMHELVGDYLGRAPREPIVCFVVRDLNTFPTERLKPDGILKIAERAGVTIWRPLRGGGSATAEVYTCDNHGICQHEAVHAFCAMAFGSTGPVWFSEGMAEMGQYWKPDQLAVDIDVNVIRYLQNAEPKRMADIVAAGQITGDSWQAYAWRWALCHLLANNPNYARRFKQLGLNLMNGLRNDSFDNAFGPVAEHISFEYDQFVQNFGNGYRVDLCVWDWNTPAKKLSASGKLNAEIDARFGWQATRLRTVAGTSYDYQVEGEWGIGTGSESLSAEGSPAGEGRLVGVLQNNFQLSEPIELGPTGTWVAPADGQLYLRCRDSWTELDDNSGALKVTLRRTPKK